MDDIDVKNPFGTGAENKGYDYKAGEKIELGKKYPETPLSRPPEDKGQSSSGGYEETSFGGETSDTTPLLQRENERDEAWKEIKNIFPKVNPSNSPFTAGTDEFNRVVVKSIRQGGKDHLLFNKDGGLNKKTPECYYKSSW